MGANAGSANDSILSLKLNLIFGPFDTTGLYVSLGRDFQSNDARGTVIITDPKTGDPVDQVTPLVRSKGLKFGVRTSFVPALQTSLSLHRLGFASDLWFGVDAGTPEAGRPSRRTGLELANFHKLGDRLTIDADIACPIESRSFRVALSMAFCAPLHRYLHADDPAQLLQATARFDRQRVRAALSEVDGLMEAAGAASSINRASASSAGFRGREIEIERGCISLSAKLGLRLLEAGHPLYAGPPVRETRDLEQARHVGRQ